MKCNKKYVGILYAIVIIIIFHIIDYGCSLFLDGVACYLFSSGQRLIFGCVAVGIFCKLYNKNIGDVFTPKKLEGGFSCRKWISDLFYILCDNFGIGN